MTARCASRLAALGTLLVAGVAHADSTVLLEGEVPDDGVAYFEIPFEVPTGTAEIEIRHDDLSEANILDWGLLSPEGFRGYGGGNTEPAITGLQSASRSYLPGPVTAGTWRIYVGEAQIVERPARYRVEVILRDVAALAPEPERAPYAPVAALDTDARWYAGDFHVHSRESGDASPTLDEVLDFAESRGLEFVMLSEHNTTSQLERYADVQARHPGVLLVPGIEVTTYEGHAMSMGGTRWIDHRLGFSGRTIDQVAADVHAEGALFSINHPALDIGDLCIGCGWRAMASAEGIDAFEVQTGAYSVTGRLFFRSATSMWEDLVLAGHHVAAVGGSDDHRAGTGTGRFDSPIGSPTTMVFASELSVAALLEGVRLGRTVVKLEGPDDPMIELRAAELPEGSDTIVADETSIVVRVTGATEGATLRIVRDGVQGAPIDIVGAMFEHEERVIAGPGESALRAQLVIGGQPRVVTSHVFVRPRTPGGPDAGLSPDASAAELDDAGASDAGPIVAPSACGCRAHAHPRPSGWLVCVLVALAGAHRARRRRTGAA
ncbi:MAG: CehA/McbA family metallohydrolase [Sandaracinus sp.]